MTSSTMNSPVPARDAAPDVSALMKVVSKWRTDADAAEYAIDRLGERFRERCEAIAGTRRQCAAELERALKEDGR